MKRFELNLAELHSRSARHLKNLRIFTEDGPRWSRVAPEEQKMIINQLTHMEGLVSALEARMRFHHIPV